MDPCRLDSLVHSRNLLALPDGGCGEDCFRFRHGRFHCPRHQILDAPPPQWTFDASLQGHSQSVHVDYFRNLD